MIRLFTLLFSLVCFTVLVWFGVTVDLGERTLFGHLRAIASSQEANELWEGSKAKLQDFIGIEAAKKASEKAEAARKAAKDATRSYIQRGGTRTLFEPAGPPQEKLSARDQKEMTDEMERLTDSAPGPRTRPAAPAPAPAKRTGVQGRAAPREPEKVRAQAAKPN